MLRNTVAVVVVSVVGAEIGSGSCWFGMSCRGCCYCCRSSIASSYSAALAAAAAVQLLLQL